MADPLPPSRSDLECKIQEVQMKRRLEYRMEFLKKRTDPCQHAAEAGYVFDPALQRFMSMKCTQFQTFKPSASSAYFTLLSLAPMVLFGAFVWKGRAMREQDIRCGKIPYRCRWFKLC